MNALWDILSGAGTVLDTPHAFVRTALSGRNPFPGIFDPEQRASGRDMLQSWGVAGEDQEGWDAGDIGGLAVELLDPFTIIPGLKGGKYLGKMMTGSKRPAILDEIERLGSFRKSDDLDDLAMKYLEPDYPPVKFEKEAAPLLTELKPQQRYQDWLSMNAVKDESGKPLRLFHGTGNVFDDFSPDAFSSGAGGDFMGRGVYMTDNPKIASGYAEQHSPYVMNPNVREQRLLAGKIIDTDQPLRGGDRDAMRSFLSDIENDLDWGPEPQEALELLERGRPAHEILRLGMEDPAGTARDVFGGPPAIRYPGGRNTGSAPHNAYVAPDPHMVVPANPTIEQLERLRQRYTVSGQAAPFSALFAAMMAMQEQDQ